MISVVIPCYRQGHYLAEAITSALALVDVEREVVVVNDGSPDRTDEIARAFGDRIVYVAQENRGLSAARNAGVRASRGAYVAFLDADDVLLPGSLRRRSDVLDQNPNVGLVCGDAILFDEQGDRGPKSRWSGRPTCVDNFRWETVEYYATPSTVMLRRASFDVVGGFDEYLRNAAEDWLMWVQLSRFVDMVYLDAPLARYRLHAANATGQRGRIDAGNRYAVAKVVAAPYFREYPAHFRARLLYYRGAAGWRFESKPGSIAFFLRAVLTDSRQIAHGLRVLRRGVRNTLARWLGRA